MNNISLKDFLEKMKELPDDIDFNFEGQGDGTFRKFTRPAGFSRS